VRGRVAHAIQTNPVCIQERTTVPASIARRGKFFVAHRVHHTRSSCNAVPVALSETAISLSEESSGCKTPLPAGSCGCVRDQICRVDRRSGCLDCADFTDCSSFWRTACNSCWRLGDRCSKAQQLRHVAERNFYEPAPTISIFILFLIYPKRGRIGRAFTLL